MKNLSLALKMLLLTLVLIGTTLLVGYVAINRLGTVNDQTRQLVDKTMEKQAISSSLHVKFLAAIRAQKNAILAPDDEKSKAFAKSSQENLSDSKTTLVKIKELVGDSSSDGQRAAVDTLDKVLGTFEETNNECLKLSVLNTNLKARTILSGELQRQVKSLSSHFETWASELSKKPTPTPEDLSRLKRIYDINNSLLELYPTAEIHIASSSDDEMRSQEVKLSELQSQIQTGLQTAVGGDAASLVQPNATLVSIQNALRELISLSRQNTNNLSAELSLGKAKLAADGVVAKISDMDQLFAKEATVGRDKSENIYTNGLWWILASAAAGLILGCLLAYVLTRSITRPILEVRNLSQSMANGDLRQRIHLDQTDEVGQLSTAANSLADSLSSIVMEIQKVSSSLGGSADDLAGVSNQLISQSEVASSKATSVASASEELSNNISTMASAAEQMSASVASISSASEEMSINVGTISSAAEQTSTNVNVVSSAVDEISSSFADVLKDVREGSNVAGDASRMADSATETIQLLNRSGTEISKVTETIKMIALQTNLLALNATIEATSAGEAGKGFAVVAHEIKELANQSAKAAEDIARKIEGVQNNTRQAVDVIQNVSQIIKDINALSGRISASVEKQTRAASMISQNVGEANKGVGDIARSIAEVAKAAGDMSRNVAEAARGATDVSRNVAEAAKAAGGISSDIHGVSEASGATNGSASRVGHSAQQLDQIGRELRGLVSRFKLNQDLATKS